MGESSASVDRHWSVALGLLALILLGGIFLAEGSMGQSAESLSRLIELGTLEKLCGGFLFTEGPLWNREGYVIFTDIPANRINRWEPEKGSSVFREPSQNSNGLSYDREGRLLACEHGSRSVTRTLTDGKIETAAELFEGKRLNSPNDVTVASSGRIYFTDPPFGVAEGDRELDFAGVYSVGADGEVRLENRGMNRPNGLAFSPDESVLYVDDTVDMLIKAFPVGAEGRLGEPSIFARLDGAGADGMKVDTEGHVFVAGPRGVWIWDKAGAWIGLLETPEQPSNCAFGGVDGKTLFITARTSLYRVRTKVVGIYPQR
jgi:gluconolactonase